MCQGLISKTKDMVKFSDLKLKNEDECLQEAIRLRQDKAKPRRPTKGMFDDEMKPALASKTDKKWLLKANPAYAERLMKIRELDDKTTIRKKIAARLLDDLTMKALR